MKQLSKNIVLRILQAYKFAVSPWLGAACRFQPTCSEYAMHAVERHGTLLGTLMTFWRVLRCHPFSAGGYDPVGLDAGDSTMLHP
jgi:uncharacterized protein